MSEKRLTFHLTQVIADTIFSCSGLNKYLTTKLTTKKKYTQNVSIKMRLQQTHPSLKARKNTDIADNHSYLCIQLQVLRKNIPFCIPA